MVSRPARKRIRLPLTSYRQGNAFFITIGTYMRHPWFVSHIELAAKAQQLLSELSFERGSRLYAWCIMPDHIHLLLQDPNVVDFVRVFKGRMTQKAAFIEKGRKLWQRSFHDHGLRREETLEGVARYIWENPVRKGMVEYAPAYPLSGSEVWSNWRYLFGRG